MNIKAIIYQSGTGHAKEYAELLSEVLGIPALHMMESQLRLKSEDQIILVGWIRNRDLMGYGILAKRFNIKAVCAVGAVDETNSHYALERIEKRYHIREKAELFYLRGGFDRKTLQGWDRRIAETLIEDLIKKTERARKKGKEPDPYQQALLNALLRGGNFVNRDNLKEVVIWAKSV